MIRYLRCGMTMPDPAAAPIAALVEPPAAPARASRWRAPLRWLGRGVAFLARVLLVSWAGLAIYYSNLPWAWARLVLAASFVAFAISAVWLTRRPSMRLAVAGLFVGVVVWFSCIRPSHDRPWRPEVAVLPRAVVEGDRVRVTGFRHFDYRSRDDFTPRYEERTFSLAHLTSVDLFISYWQVGPMGHTFVSFNFDDGAPPLCISIEARPEVGEAFAALPSMFKRLELMYVVGDERDLVRVRTDHRDEEVYLYRLRASPEGVRRLLLVYLDRINELAEDPEFYHLLSNSCTVNIVRYANAAGRQGRFDVRHLLNGYVDGYLYASGRVDTTLPFADLRARSRITDVARAAGDAPDFSARIRAGLPQPTP
jgi:hypothetical protein